MRPQRPRYRGPPGCPECGGMLIYDRDSKIYTCTACGRTYTREELAEERRKIREEMIKTLTSGYEDEKEKMYKDYLKWYLSGKK